MFKRTFVVGLILLGLAGCATSTRYVSYTYENFPAKSDVTNIDVYPPSQALGTSHPYYVIGKVSVEGFASNGVTPGSLTHQAQQIARRKGADAIINAQTQAMRYIYSGDSLLRFTGELIVYTPTAKT
jgi:hypothetical protein